jgi:LuxR family transcriptional regulator, maltose regulon positive regulatory protein
MSKLEHTQHAGRYELLSTKLTSPRLRSSLVSREQLLARLDEGLEHKLTLLSAPAGFGKTTLVSEWIATRSERHDSPPVAWVSLDAGDNDPVRFWRYVITACQVFDPAVGESTLALLHTSRRPSLESVLATFINELATFINELAQLACGGVLVLEDYHVITTPQIHESVAFLLDHLPATLHLLMLTRSDPPLPLARLRAHGDLSELHAADLRFSLQETRAFLRQALPFPLTAEVITRLEARTEGWVAGLRLLALALQGRKDPQDLEHVLATFTGSHRHILEYLVADVLSSQPEPLQEFLLQTSVLSRLTGSLCDTVTGRNDSERVLEQLERANLFLIPLDGAGRWYRYHALFAEAMQHEARRRLGEDHLRSLYDKASLWYEQHRLLTEAIEVALYARDFARAAVLIERLVEPQHLNEVLHTLYRWIEELPEEVLHAHPVLCLTYAMILLFTRDRSAPATRALLEVPLQMAERYWLAEGNRPKLGEVLALRSQVALWQGDLPQAFAAARQALEWLPSDELLWRASSMLTVGMEELLAGKLDAARQATLEARACFEVSGNIYGTRATLFVLGEASARQGELHQAASLYRQVLAEAEEDPLDRGSALVNLASLSYEWNELETAEQQASQALELGKQHIGEVGKYHAEQLLQVPGSLVLARVLHARGENAQAQQLLQELMALTQERRWPHLHREVLACQAQMSISAGDLAAAQRWSNTCAQLGEDFRLVQREREALIVARLLIAQGEAEEALRLLERWQAEAHAQGRARSVLETRVLTALAHFSDKRLPQARQTLREALAFAQAQGYQRLFLDEGEAMATVLRAVLLDVRGEALVTYVQNLLRAFPQVRAGRGASSLAASALLIEPLSAQEQRVLRLLAAGRSNPEIAQELVVSVNTVKTQAQSIYRKLNVKSRMEAGEAARRLKLL